MILSDGLPPSVYCNPITSDELDLAPRVTGRRSGTESHANGGTDAMRRGRSIILSWAATAILVVTATAAFASSFGTLSNFDVVNDTGHECHGFEIELEDVHPSDAPYTFGGSCIRYGSPEVLDTTVDPAHPRVVVRYRHWNGVQWEATPVAPGGVTPGGHDCFSGGAVGNYARSGCEHYGVSLSASPTRTTYRWLVAAQPSSAASTFSVVPETVNLPVPVWNVIPQAGGGVNVRAEVEPIEEENHARYGEPQWLKVFKVESDQDLQPEDLNKLLLGIAGGVVPDETEIETEWKLIQSKPGNAEGEQEDADVKEDPLDAGKRSVIRRYEFYTYNGPRDPENNEAQPCVNDDSPVPAEAPVDGCSDIGDFVGAQNVAVDVDLAAVDNALPDGEVGIAYPATPLVIGGLPPHTVQVTGGAEPDGLQVDPVTGVLSGTPTQAGAFSFEIQASDSAGGVVTGTFDVNVTVDLCPDDPAKTDPGACGCAVEDTDVNGNGVVDCLETTIADLGVSVGVPKAAPRAGRRLRIALRVSNSGPSAVTEATISAAISGGPFDGLKLPRTCTGTADAIVCSTGRVGSGRRPGRKTRTISLVPAPGALITVDATVSSPVYDPNPSNQGASLTVTVP